MAQAIYDNMISRGLSDDAEVMNPIIDEWVELMVPLWKSHSIDSGGYVACPDEGAAHEFVAKYPRLQELIDLCKAEALTRWPQATFSLELHSDPEGCHKCCEGQHITLYIHTDLDFDGPDKELGGSPYDRAADEWLAWVCDDGSPHHALTRDIGEVAYLFSSSLKWKEDE
jgi:hypothetical protein